MHDPEIEWTACVGDLENSFFQGSRERDDKVYLIPPRDPLVIATGAWPHSLYEVTGNIYGFADAPLVLCRHVRRKMYELGFVSHSLAVMCFF